MIVSLIVALTADGFIARHQQQNSTQWTSKEDAQFFSKKTKQAGVIIMGKTTFETIGRPLPGRLNLVLTPEVTASKWDNLEFVKAKPEELLADLNKRGCKEVFICGGATIYTLFMKAGLVNKMFITREPVLFGQGMTLFKENLENIKLKLVKVHRLSAQTIVQEYQVSYRS